MTRQDLTVDASCWPVDWGISFLDLDRAIGLQGKGYMKEGNGETGWGTEEERPGLKTRHYN